MKKRLKDFLYRLVKRGFKTDEKENKWARNASLNKVRFEGQNFVGLNSSLTNTSLGAHSYCGRDVTVKYAEIGRFCSIGPGTNIGLGIHPTDLVSSHPAFYANNKPYKTFADKVYVEEYKPIKIGHDVWVAGNVQIVGGIKIGTGAIIAAGSVVTKDVEPYGIYGGVPAKLIRYRFDEKTREALLKSKWWNQDLSLIEGQAELFRDLEAFLKAYSGI